jgi:hypothetical protein
MDHDAHRNDEHPELKKRPDAPPTENRADDGQLQYVHE